MRMQGRIQDILYVSQNFHHESGGCDAVGGALEQLGVWGALWAPQWGTGRSPGKFLILGIFTALFKQLYCLKNITQTSKNSGL